MLSRVRNHFKDAKLSRMSSGTYCIIRDLGLVKGGKGMRHHEVLMTFSLGALGRLQESIARAERQAVGVAHGFSSDDFRGQCKLVAHLPHDH